MEVILIWWPNTEKNKDSSAKNVPLTLQMIMTAEPNVHHKKFIKLMIMDMLVKDIMVVPMKKL